jgi:uncharacterized protein YggE
MVILANNLEPKMRLTPIYLCPIAFGLAVTLAAPATRAGDKEIPRTITVSASGQVAAEPDQARITSGVTTEAATAREALSRNTEAMKKVIAGLKASGIEAKDIQTTSFHIEPRYTRPKEGEAALIDGYRVSNQVQVLSRNLDRLGEILDQLVTLGANEMAGLSFEVSEAETLRDEARKEAVANALRRAKLYAAAAGAEVGDVLTIQEGGDMGPRPMPMARAMKAEAVPIERGTEMLEASVTVTWALK